jgi:prepilin-type N-terminal cleavage/methylation domain-containing protein
MNKRAFTLMEIIVATLLLSLVLYAMANVFVGARLKMLHSRARVSSVEVGKFFLEPLYADVNAATWSLGTTCLSSLGAAGCPPETTIDNVPGKIKYTPVYAVCNPNLDPACIPDLLGTGAELRKVRVTITWLEYAPQ